MDLVRFCRSHLHMQMQMHSNFAGKRGCYSFAVGLETAPYSYTSVPASVLTTRTAAAPEAAVRLSWFCSRRGSPLGWLAGLDGSASWREDLIAPLGLGGRKAMKACRR
jgi:hypothetical protein